MKKQALKFYDDQPVADDMQTEVIRGLRDTQKTLPAKYFYDERGSELFEEITRLPEYYLTRTEISLLEKHAPQIAELLEDDVWLLEYGSGASRKIRILLQSIRPDCYVPMDISKDFLLASADRLQTDYPWLNVYAACVDYSQPVTLPEDMNTSTQKFGFFPGSSIGNFSPEEALDFLSSVRTTLGNNGAMLIGVDLQKDTDTLEAAYNDAQGVTADFNLNILHHLNETLDAGFQTERFRHQAHYNTEEHRIEMHLISNMDQVVRVGSEHIGFKAEESIHTENSYKYSQERFAELASKSGFRIQHFWTDENQHFGLFFLRCTDS